MFTQLNPPIPLHVIGKGHGHAIGLIDYGAEHDLIWVTAIDDTAEIWCAPNPRVRMRGNWTMGRMASQESGTPTPAAEPCADCVELMAAAPDHFAHNPQSAG